MEVSENKEKSVHEVWAEEAFDNLVDALESIHANEITVLTGDNGTGKSLIRKLLWKQLEEELGFRVKVADTSMERRTGLHSELGGGGVFCRDAEWVATSENSIRFMRSVLMADERFIVLDEPEIGLSESMQLSVAKFLNEKLPEVMKKNYGVLIITHSKIIIENLDCIGKFVNIQKLTKEDYLAKEPECIDLEEFDKRSSALFKLLQSHLK